MAMDFTAQINKALVGKTCQAFDPLMLIESKAAAISDGATRLSTSCAAPAYAYVSGSHGNKFLCDFHYFFEKNAELQFSTEQHDKVFEFVVDQTMQVAWTFDSPPPTRELRPEGYKCWCGSEPYVFYREMNSLEISDQFCNFHHRKYLYRCLSNGIDITKKFVIDDYRRTMRDWRADEEFWKLGEV